MHDVNWLLLLGRDVSDCDGQRRRPAGHGGRGAAAAAAVTVAHAHVRSVCTRWRRADAPVSPQAAAPAAVFQRRRAENLLPRARALLSLPSRAEPESNTVELSDFMDGFLSLSLSLCVFLSLSLSLSLCLCLCQFVRRLCLTRSNQRLLLLLSEQKMSTEVDRLRHKRRLRRRCCCFVFVRLRP